MKKLISILAMLATAFMATASPNYVSQSLLNNCQWVVVPTNTTVYYFATNVTYEMPITPNGWTNVLTLNTNLNGNIVPQWEKDASTASDSLGNVSSNWNISVMVNNTNLLLNTKPGGAYPIIPLTWFNTNGTLIYGSVTNIYTNSYGIISTNIAFYYPVPPVIPSATSTNQLTFTFAPEIFPGFYSTNAVDLLSFSVTNNFMGSQSSQNGFTYTYQIPTANLAGRNRWRLFSITSAAAFGTSTGSLINDIRLNGWNP